MRDHSPIDLAYAEPFRLGPVSVRPGVREIVHDDGAREVLEPRVMQVLVALAQADGEIITRDDLTARCWEGRVVGEDAISRVISRLRRLEDGIAKGAFQLETITKVGYRLLLPDTAAKPDAAAPTATSPPPATVAAPARPDRRLLLAGGGALGAVAIGVAGYRALRSRRRTLTPAVQAIYDQGWTALGNASPDQVDQGAGLFRQVVAAAPAYADGWGALAVAYVLGAEAGDPSQRTSRQVLARSAAERALQLEAHNALAEVAVSRIAPLYGDWAAQERTIEAASRRHPTVPFLARELAWLQGATGRMVAAAETDGRVMSLGPPSPIKFYRRVIYLWAANRLEEAEQAARLAIETYRRSRPLWFTIFYFYMYTGRPEQALAQSADLANRPVGVGDEDFERVEAVARAVRSRDKADIDRAIDLNMGAARLARGYAENALQFAAYLGRPDAAFQVAEAYYFGRGFQLGPLAFAPNQGQFYGEPRTYFLFLPSVAPIHGDPRFDRLMGETGLKDYWAKTGHTPDYLKRKT